MPDQQPQPDERAVIDALGYAFYEPKRILDALRLAVPFILAERDAEHLSDAKRRAYDSIAHARALLAERDAKRQPEPVRGGGQPDAEHLVVARWEHDADTNDTYLVVVREFSEPQPGAVVGQPEQPAEPGYDPATGVYTLSDQERDWLNTIYAPDEDGARFRAYAAYLRARADSDGEQPGAHGGR